MHNVYLVFSYLVIKIVFSVSLFAFKDCKLHLNLLLFQMLESALSLLLEGRHILEETISYSFKNEEQVYAKFWSQLQMVLKRMLATTLSANTSKSPLTSQQSLSGRSGDVGKVRELYKMSLKSTEFGQLHAMHRLWTS